MSQQEVEQEFERWIKDFDHNHIYDVEGLMQYFMRVAFFAAWEIKAKREAGIKE